MASDPWSASATSPDRVVISVDAMGGDRGPAAVVAGLVAAVAQHADLDIILHGDEAQLQPLGRFAFIGKGALLTARVYELPDTTTPIVEVSGTDTEPYTSGVTGLLVYDNSSTASAPADATFDNYFTSDVEPPRIKMMNLDFGAWELSWTGEASQFVLQSSTSLTGSAADWTDVPPVDIIPPSDVIPSYRYNMGAFPENGGLPKQFFRLVRRPIAAN